MSTPESSEQNQAGAPVPMAGIVNFIRQLSHDLRNHLNAAELQAAYINEISEDAEVKGELKRLRGILTEMASTLQGITGKLAPLKLTSMPYEARAFLEDLRQKLAAQFPKENETIDWEIAAGSAKLEIDPQLLQEAFLELFANAFQHERGLERLRASGRIEGDKFSFTLREPKETVTASLESWGREPFRHLSRGHYGLGLHRMRNIVQAHGGQFEVSHDAGMLVSKVVLPASP